MGEAAALLRRAAELRLEGKLAEAGTLLERALGLDPQAWRARLELANVRRAQARPQDAIAEFERVARARPDEPVAWWLLAQTLCETGDAAAAVDPIQRYVALQLSDPIAQARGAELLLDCGHLGSARALIGRARSIHPTDAVLRFLESRVLFEDGDTETAIEAYQDATRNAPHLGAPSGGRLTEAWLLDCKSWAKTGRGGYRPLAPAQWLTLAAPGVIPADEAYLWGARAQRVPETFVATIEGAEVVGREFPVLSPDGCLMLEGFVTSPEVFLRKGLTVKCASSDGRVLLDLPRDVRRVETPCVLLGRSTNYFHFLLESLPRISSLEQAGVGAELPALVPAGLLPTQLEMLALLGFPERRLIALPEDASVKCDTLYAPSLLNHGYTVPSSAVDFLRERLLGAVADVSDLPKRVYLSRNRMSRRRVRNEPELVPLIERHGFRVVYPESLSVAEQLRLFAQAEAVLSPDSSALSNLVFASSGTKVGVLSWRGLHKPLWHCLASHVGAKLTYIHTDSIAESSTAIAHRDMHVDPRLLAEWLAGIG